KVLERVHCRRREFLSIWEQRVHRSGRFSDRWEAESGGNHGSEFHQLFRPDLAHVSQETLPQSARHADLLRVLRATFARCWILPCGWRDLSLRREDDDQGLPAISAHRGHLLLIGLRQQFKRRLMRVSRWKRTDA